MELPGGTSPARNFWTKVRGSSSRTRKLAMRALAAVLVVLVGGGIFFGSGLLRAGNVFKGGTASVAALKENVAPQLLKGEGAGRINVLLLGRGGGNHSAPDLTDTMMLASIDPVNHTATLLSVPRDLWVQVPNAATMKINAAYQTGVFKYLGRQETGSTDPKAISAGFDTVDQAIEMVLGVTVNYNVLVNFKAFQDAVNAVGGVDINVPENLYDPTMAWENGNNPYLAKAGQQVMDGKHALIYARSRETSSDFARAQRQRGLILALKEKVQTLGTLSNPLKMNGLLNSFGNNVTTDFSLSDISRFATIMKSIDNGAVSSVSLADANNPQVTTGNMNGQSIVLPKAGLFKYGPIQNYVRSALKDGYILKENAKILVLNGTLVPGLATKKADELKAYGYNIIGTGNAPGGAYPETSLVDLTHGAKKYTQNYLEQRFNVKATTVMPDNTIQTNGADFVIIVTANESSRN